MKSNDDNLYAATVRQTPKSWWGWRLLEPSRKQDPRQRQNLKLRTPKKSVWALRGPEELR
jgi:hypothetical protein